MPIAMAAVASWWNGTVVPMKFLGAGAIAAIARIRVSRASVSRTMLSGIAGRCNRTVVATETPNALAVATIVSPVGVVGCALAIAINRSITDIGAPSACHLEGAALSVSVTVELDLCICLCFFGDELAAFRHDSTTRCIIIAARLYQHSVFTTGCSTRAKFSCLSFQRMQFRLP
jgi:hypothetical protein